MRTKMDEYAYSSLRMNYDMIQPYRVMHTHDIWLTVSLYVTYHTVSVHMYQYVCMDYVCTEYRVAQMAALTLRVQACDMRVTRG